MDIVRLCVLPESLESVVSVDLWHIGRGIANKGISLWTIQPSCHGPTKGPTYAHYPAPVATPYFPNHNVLPCHHHNQDSIRHTIGPQNQTHAALSVSQMWPEVWPAYSVPLNSDDWETVAPIDTMGNKPLYPTNFNRWR